MNNIQQHLEHCRGRLYAGLDVAEPGCAVVLDYCRGLRAGALRQRWAGVLTREYVGDGNGYGNGDGNGNGYGYGYGDHQVTLRGAAMASRIQIITLSSGYRDTIIVGVPAEPDYLAGTVEISHAQCVRKYADGGIASAAPSSPGACTLDKISGPGIYVAQLSKVVGRMYVDDDVWAPVLGLEDA